MTIKILPYLIAEDTDAAGFTDFVVSEPYRGQSSRNGQNAGLADCHHSLTEKCDPKALGGYAEHFYPGTDSGPECPDDHRPPEALKNPTRSPIYLSACVGINEQEYPRLCAIKYSDITWRKVTLQKRKFLNTRLLFHHL